MRRRRCSRAEALGDSRKKKSFLDQKRESDKASSALCCRKELHWLLVEELPQRFFEASCLVRILDAHAMLDVLSGAAGNIF